METQLLNRRLQEARERESELAGTRDAHVAQQTMWLREEIERALSEKQPPPGGASPRQRTPPPKETVDLTGTWQLESQEDSGSEPVQYPLYISHNAASGELSGTAEVNLTHFRLTGTFESEERVSFNLHWGVGAISSIQLQRVGFPPTLFTGAYINSYNGSRGRAVLRLRTSVKLIPNMRVTDVVTNKTAILEGRYTGDSAVLEGSWWLIDEDGVRRLRTEAEISVKDGADADGGPAPPAKTWERHLPGGGAAVRTTTQTTTTTQVPAAGRQSPPRPLSPAGSAGLRVAGEAPPPRFADRYRPISRGGSTAPAIRSRSPGARASTSPNPGQRRRSSPAPPEIPGVPAYDNGPAAPYNARQPSPPVPLQTHETFSPGGAAAQYELEAAKLAFHQQLQSMASLADQWRPGVSPPRVTTSHAEAPPAVPPNPIRFLVESFAERISRGADPVALLHELYRDKEVLQGQVAAEAQRADNLEAQLHRERSQRRDPSFAAPSPQASHTPVRHGSRQPSVSVRLPASHATHSCGAAAPVTPSLNSPPRNTAGDSAMDVPRAEPHRSTPP
eukprot:gene19457-29985_t